jgi:hypothetical protein
MTPAYFLNPFENLSPAKVQFFGALTRTEFRNWREIVNGKLRRATPLNYFDARLSLSREKKLS